MKDQIKKDKTTEMHLKALIQAIEKSKEANGHYCLTDGVMGAIRDANHRMQKVLKKF